MADDRPNAQHPDRPDTEVFRRAAALVRRFDAQADKGKNPITVMEEQGVDCESLTYLASNRYDLLERGAGSELMPGVMVLSGEAQRFMSMLMWLEGYTVASALAREDAAKAAFEMGSQSAEAIKELETKRSKVLKALVEKATRSFEEHRVAAHRAREHPDEFANPEAVEWEHNAAMEALEPILDILNEGARS